MIAENWDYIPLTDYLVNLVEEQSRAENYHPIKFLFSLKWWVIIMDNLSIWIINYNLANPWKNLCYYTPPSV